MHLVFSMLENISGFALFVIYAYLAIVVIFIVMENRDISSTLAWILIFLLFPIVGFVLYIFFGRNWKVVSPNKKEHIRDIQNKFDNVLADARKRQDDFIKTLSRDTISYGRERMLRIAQQSTDSLLTFHNDIEILQSGKGKFKRLKEDISHAKKFVHLEYFIWRDDSLTREFRDLLIKKAQEGVEVRILYDPIGSLLTRIFHPKHFSMMRAAGVEVAPFYNKLSPLKITTINYLLHRKIVVIDGHTAYTGGMNMGKEYIDGGRRFDAWRDTHVRIAGEAVLSLQASFAVNWEESTGRSLFDEKYFQKCLSREYSDLMIQVISSDPHAYWQTIRQSLFAMAMAARDHVYIQTPYFIPDANLFEALKIIALSGVRVKIMVAGMPDKKIAHWAAFTYFEELLNAGVEIYHYNKGFLHAKTFIIDGTVCSIGTTNMDIRSLHLSYENNVVIFDRKTTQYLEKDFNNDLIHCNQFTIDDYKKIGMWKKLRNSLVRLLSPLL
jgi:cardiolipin synthase A/B